MYNITSMGTLLWLMLIIYFYFNFLSSLHINDIIQFKIISEFYSPYLQHTTVVNESVHSVPSFVIQEMGVLGIQSDIGGWSWGISLEQAWYSLPHSFYSFLLTTHSMQIQSSLWHLCWYQSGKVKTVPFVWHNGSPSLPDIISHTVP